jgi:hypothetical protein
MAEREGFEPSVPLLAVHTISNRAPSASRASLLVLDVFVLAEREGFEPPVLEKGQPISSRPRYDHFGTSPYLFALKKAFIKEPA